SRSVALIVRSGGNIPPKRTTEHCNPLVVRLGRLAGPWGRTSEHINGIEGFWSYAKHWLYTDRGVPQHHFPLYLKEIECRFNHRDEDLLALFAEILTNPVSDVT